MNVGVYTGASALNALERWQEVIARNISSASVPGYKKAELVFTGEQEPLNAGAGGTLPTIKSHTNFSAGQIRQTGSELDFAIQGSGFFQVQQPTGELGYTRDGEFHVGPDKTLVTKHGYPVMGEAGPITFKEGAGPIAINADGVITQRDEPVAKLPTYDFTDPQTLRRSSGGLFTAAPESGVPLPIESPTIVNGYLEGSNVSALNEMVNLITVSRAYEASQKIITSSDDTTGRAIEILGAPTS